MPKPTDVRHSILSKMLVITLVPATLLVFIVGSYFYFQARSGLEQEMGRRLTAIARTLAVQIDVGMAMNFVAGDEQRRPYQSFAQRLGTLAQANDVDRIYVVRLDQTIQFDTDPDGVIGQKMYRLAGDRSELKQIAAGEATASTMFQGDDGRLYKAGYAPLVVDDKIVGLIGVDAGVAFFAQLRQTRLSIVLITIIGLLMLAVASIWFARRLVRPIQRLADSARRIGDGDLTTPIELQSRDEIGLLADMLNQMRVRIVERDRYLQMLQRGIAHEVRNPLGGMELYCDILADELKGQEQALDHLKKIRREVKGLDAVVNEFLDFTRETVPDIRAVNIKEFLAELLMMYAGKAEPAGIVIDKAIDEKFDKGWFDPDLIRRVLHNVLLNAIQAMPQGGKLSLIVKQESDELTIVVKDTGVGIPDEVKESIFTPFVTTKDSGTGLGLPFARKIVEGHRGAIGIESERGKGTIVTIRLPHGKAKE